MDMESSKTGELSELLGDPTGELPGVLNYGVVKRFLASLKGYRDPSITVSAPDELFSCPLL